MDKYREDIKKQLTTLSTKRQLLFGVIICERLYPGYVEFNRIHGWGNIDILQEAIAMMRQYLIDENLFDTDEIQEIIERVEMNTPDMDNFSSVLASLALNSCTAIYSTLKFMLDRDVDDIADVASYARDTIDAYLQEKYNLDPNDPTRNERVESDQLMVHEKWNQKQVLINLSAMTMDKVTDQVVNQLSEKKLELDFSLLRK